MIAAHADWSLDARKRWVTLARREGREWQARAPRLVGDPATLAAGGCGKGPLSILMKLRVLETLDSGIQ